MTMMNKNMDQNMKSSKIIFKGSMSNRTDESNIEIKQP